jgi:GT2 family glycosyltransferase
MDLSIITVNYKMKDLIEACYKSIQSAAPALQYEIILVDNNSEDGSAEYFQKHWPDVTVIANTDNAGFARACNQGAAVARGDMLLFLNPDTEAPHGAMEAMVDFLRNTPDAGVCGPETRNIDGSIEPSVYRLPTLKRTAVDCLGMNKIFAGYEVRDYEPLTGRPRVEVICGACFMIKKDLFHKLGGFDEALWMYGEDVELCYRVLRAGFHCHYLDDVQIIHKRGERHLQEDAFHDMERIAYSHYKWIFYYYEKHCSVLARSVLRSLLWTSVYPKLVARKRRAAGGDTSRDNVSRIKALKRVLDEFILRRRHT